MSLACYHCGKQIRGEATHTQPTRLTAQLGDFPKAYHPACYAAAEFAAGLELAERSDVMIAAQAMVNAGQFTLTREPATKAKRATFESTKSTQRVLLTGLDCLPGQNDLFTT